MIENYEKFSHSLYTMIMNRFNVNLVGPNGCGKTQLVKDNFSSFYGDLYLYLTISDLVDPEFVLKKFKSFIIDLSNNIINRLDNSNPRARRFKLENEKYSEILNEYVKKMKKIYAPKKFNIIYEEFENLNDILVKAGEINPELRDLKNTLQSCYVIIDSIDDIKIFENFKILKNFHKICVIARSFNMKLLFISNYELKLSELSSGIFDFTDTYSLMYPCDKKEEYVERIKDKFMDKFYITLDTFHDNEYLLNTSIKNYKTNFCNFNQYLNNFSELIAEENTKHTVKFLKQKLNRQISNSYLNYHDKNNKILTNRNQEGVSVSLSHCQKIMLVSAFLASEIHSKLDLELFKTTKQIKIKKNKSKTKQYNLLRIGSSATSFNVKRLTAIYSSLKSIIDDQEKTDDETGVEFAADLNSLIILKLIKIAKSKVNGIINGISHHKSLVCNINKEFAFSLADEYDIRLDDFLAIELLHFN